MNNRNLGILIVVIAIAAAAICFAVLKGNKTDTASAATVASTDSTIEPAAGKTPDKTSDKTAAATPAPAEATPDNPVVAIVDGQKVLRSEVMDFMKNFPPQMQQMPPETLFPIAVEQVVTAKVVDAKAAKEPELQNDPETAKRMADAKVQIIRTVFLEKEIEKQLTDARIQKDYDKFKDTQSKIQEVHARHILVDSEDTAKDIIKKIQGGAKFEDLAKQYSKDSSNKDNGGDLGYFTKETMVKEFADAAFAMNKGDVSKTPVKTQFGWHVIEVLDKRNKAVPTLEEAKPALAAEERRQILNDTVSEWRKKADVTLFDINGKPVEKKKDDAAEDAPKADTKK